MSQPAVRVEGLWKEYVVGQARGAHGTFYDLLSASLKAPFRRLRPLGGNEQSADTEHFWALKDVSFEVQAGEVIGVIGRNGAGKSTLLKILSRITAPTQGRVSVRGRLASLLEVGTGFHPELSGRENIFLNGAILGMTRAEVTRKFDEIVAFAEVEKFVDTPVKRYSSGMYVRLAFSVAASLDVDVLIVDEVLAVGDTAFQEKCLARMGDLSSGGRTVLLVSHNLSAVSRLCSRAVVLDQGKLAFDGAASEALVEYAALMNARIVRQAIAGSGPLSEVALLTSLAINGSTESYGQIVKPEDPIRFEIAGKLLEALRGFRVTLCVFKGDQMVLCLHDAAEPGDVNATAFQSVFTIPNFFLSPGTYSVDVNMYSTYSSRWVVWKGIASFSVATEWHVLYEPTHAMGMVNLRQAGTRTYVHES